MTVCASMHIFVSECACVLWYCVRLRGCIHVCSFFFVDVCIYVCARARVCMCVVCLYVYVNVVNV